LTAASTTLTVRGAVAAIRFHCLLSDSFRGQQVKIRWRCWSRLCEGRVCISSCQPSLAMFCMVWWTVDERWCLELL